MDEFVKGLIKNNYLLTPAAYYILVEHFKRGEFSLAELIKFAKSRGTFIIDDGIASDFLKVKGLEAPVEEKVGFISTGEVGQEVVESREEQIIAEETQEKGQPSAEIVEEGKMSGESVSVEESFISTGTPNETLSSSSFDVLEEGIMGEISEGESSISTGNGTQEFEVPEDVFDVIEEQQGPLSNGNEEENGNGETVVLTKYGLPMVYGPEEIIEEKEYSVYEDFILEPNPNFTYAQIEPDYEVKFDVRHVKLKPPKPKNANGKEGEIIVEAYASLFRSRLKKLRRILRENPEIKTVVDIAKLKYVKGDEEVTIIGLVNDKRETNKGLIFEIEDQTGRVKVFLPKDSEDYRDAFKVLPDAVVAFRGFYSKKGIFFANKFYLPDVPLYRKQKPPLEEKVYAILISDIHVGSKEFCEKAFMKFLEWLNGYVETKEEEEIVSRTKYLIIAGDVVDGIGVYPGQYSDLVIPDIFDQYEALANLLVNVPKHITMFIGPGNHDAARPAVPQPEFYEEYAKPLYKLKNAVIISNPAVIRLHGRDFLIAHGRGIEDVVSFVPGLTHHKPGLPMVELLKMRHLAPTFGGKVPIAPDPEDLLVIEEVPDLVQMGHVHVYDAVVYRGIQLVNSATWQAQTEFQKMVNIVPTPGKVPVVDVESAKVVKVLDFSRWC
ncbi:DNA polymerase II [Thermococcus chitonophagus]|uniref:DNA polymerase II small subunit n=1 Tax=Thermococcus chitonophagus TaxID=54262 RepID=A0A160VQS4_9EURY|nr:DNA-directed DNA polymerase II small subunit [Thermococcus chitonophagus]ASJ15833.1 DNA polymerase II [Thermococcus chitonophagus]CUX77070.1 Archaeal DNA polymerase II small subunit [Thermococcus chitonophagus]